MREDVAKILKEAQDEVTVLKALGWSREDFSKKLKELVEQSVKELEQEKVDGCATGQTEEGR